MLVCDFRFPLPKGAGVMTIDPVTGGGDTIKGTIYVTNASGGTVDLENYAKRVHEYGFGVSRNPFGFSASSPDGGALTVDEGLNATKIAFSFFGDY